jgi:hypothetical protein
MTDVNKKRPARRGRSFGNTDPLHTKSILNQFVFFLIIILLATGKTYLKQTKLVLKIIIVLEQISQSKTTSITVK